MPEITTAGIIRHDGLFLVAKRKEGGSMSGRWEFPGGKADADETPRDALRREIREEFGAAARVGRHLVSTSFENHPKTYTLHVFEVFLESPDLTLHEHAEVRWLRFPDIGALDLADSDRRVFELLSGQMTVPD